MGYRQFHRPVLVGYSSGATLAYTTLVQAPVGTFLGAVSLGFCPDLMLHKPMCKGAGLSYKVDPELGQVFDPVTRLADPWVVLHGDQDQVCAPAATAAYVGKVAGGTWSAFPGWATVSPCRATGCLSSRPRSRPSRSHCPQWLSGRRKR